MEVNNKLSPDTIQHPGTSHEYEFIVITHAFHDVRDLRKSGLLDHLLLNSKQSRLVDTLLRRIFLQLINI